MVARDHYHRRIGERLANPLELPERKNDGEIGGPHRVEQITRDDDRVGPRGDDGIHRGAKRVRDVGLALVDAGRRLAIVLPEPEVQVGEMGDLHGGEITL